METVDLRTYEGRDMKKGETLGFDVGPDIFLQLQVRATAPLELTMIGDDGVVLPLDEGQYLDTNIRLIGACRVVMEATADLTLAYRGSFEPFTDGSQSDHTPVEIELVPKTPMVLPSELEMELRRRLEMMGMAQDDVDDLLDDNTDWGDFDDSDEDDGHTDYQEEVPEGSEEPEATEPPVPPAPEQPTVTTPPQNPLTSPSGVSPPIAPT